VVGALLLTAPGKVLAEVVLDGGHKLLRFADGTTARVGSEEARLLARARIDNNFYSEGAPISYGTSALVTNPDEAFFWTGRSDGVGGASVAADIAKQHRGKTLEELLSTRQILMPDFDPADPVTVNAWIDVSVELAKYASGEVRAVVGTTRRPKNIWETYELPTLMKNPSVTKIISVDPKTRLETVLFERTSR
jgi:hypothetical protein